MAKQKTRDELLVELTKAQQTNEDWAKSDESRRKEFAKAFGWVRPKNNSLNFYNTSDRAEPPTWAEIFVEIGKLKANREFRDFEGNLSELEVRIEKLEPKNDIKIDRISF